MNSSLKHLRVAIVQELLVKFGGAERVLEALCEIFPQADIHTIAYDKQKMGSFFPGHRIITSKYQWIYDRTKRQKFLLPFMRSSIEGFDFSEYDLVISSSTAVAHAIIVPSNVPHICYCHSPARYLWDYTHEYGREMGIKPRSLKEYLYRRYIKKVRMWDQGSGDRPDVMIANSANVARRIAKYYRRKSGVMYPPVDTARFTPRMHHDGYFLIVSALTPYKKLDMAIEAFRHIDRKLVIVGTGAQEEYLKSIAPDNVTFAGFQPDSELPRWYEHARAFIFSSEEDFGITPVEAMAAGKPVIAYRKGGVLETVVEGVTGEFFDEATPKSLADAVTRFIQHEPLYDYKAIAEHASQFSKEKFQAQFTELVEECFS